MGKKRTYVEAGFADAFNDEALEPAHQNAEDNPVPVAGPSFDAQSEEKKQRKSRNKKSKASSDAAAKDADDETVETKVQTPLDEETQQQNETVKSAYGRENREKLRKSTQETLRYPDNLVIPHPQIPQIAQSLQNGGG